MSRVFIGDLDRVEVLQALFNAQPGRPTGKGDGPDISYEDAAEVFELGSDYLRRRRAFVDITTDYVDYVRDRPIRIDFSGPLIDTSHYDWDAKERGFAAKVIKQLREGKG